MGIKFPYSKFTKEFKELIFAVKTSTKTLRKVLPYGFGFFHKHLWKLKLNYSWPNIDTTLYQNDRNVKLYMFSRLNCTSIIDVQISVIHFNVFSWDCSQISTDSPTN